MWWQSILELVDSPMPTTSKTTVSGWPCRQLLVPLISSVLFGCSVRPGFGACSDTDTEVPVFTECPFGVWHPVTSSDVNAIGKARVTFPPITATDNCGASNLRLKGLPASNTKQFPVGETLHKVKAIDEAGNTAICDFTVTVACNEDPVLKCPAAITALAEDGTSIVLDLLDDYVTVLHCGVEHAFYQWVIFRDNRRSTLESPFPVSATTDVKLFATDTWYGRGASCEFPVTVVSSCWGIDRYNVIEDDASNVLRFLEPGSVIGRTFAYQDIKTTTINFVARTSCDDILKVLPPETEVVQSVEFRLEKVGEDATYYTACATSRPFLAFDAPRNMHPGSYRIHGTPHSNEDCSSPGAEPAPIAHLTILPCVGIQRVQLRRTSDDTILVHDFPVQPDEDRPAQTVCREDAATINFDVEAAFCSRLKFQLFGRFYENTLAEPDPFELLGPSGFDPATPPAVTSPTRFTKQYKLRISADGQKPSVDAHVAFWIKDCATRRKSTQSSCGDVDHVVLRNQTDDKIFWNPFPLYPDKGPVLCRDQFPSGFSLDVTGTTCPNSSAKTRTACCFMTVATIRCHRKNQSRTKFNNPFPAIISMDTVCDLRTIFITQTIYFPET